MRQTALHSGSLMIAPCFSSCVAKPPSITPQPPAFCNRSSNNVAAFFIPISSFCLSRCFSSSSSSSFPWKSIRNYRRWPRKTELSDKVNMNMKECRSVSEHGRLFAQILRTDVGLSLSSKVMRANGFGSPRGWWENWSPNPFPLFFLKLMGSSPFNFLKFSFYPYHLIIFIFALQCQNLNFNCQK